jgi:hypothetical protein
MTKLLLLNSKFCLTLWRNWAVTLAGCQIIKLCVYTSQNDRKMSSKMLTL